MSPGPVRVLLADDTADIRLLTRTMLDLDGGFEVVGEAGTGVDALAMVAELVPDVVVLDLAMPEMDGLQALPKIREVAPETQVVVLSGFERQALSEEAFALGAAEYVHKGQPLSELVAVLRDVVGRPTVALDGPVAPGTDADLLAMVVHDLRSPLASIRGAADVLAADPRIAADPRARALVEIQQRQAGLMSSLIDDLLMVARVEGGQLQLTPRTVALAPLLTSLASVHVAGAEVRCPADLHAHADPVRLSQMVNNLVANASDHGAPPVVITAHRDGDHVEVAVADAGPGVPPHRVSELFTRFSPLARAGSGNGLGLYIVRELARAHGGDATYAPGDPGSRFAVRLPAAGA